MSSPAEDSPAKLLSCARGVDVSVVLPSYRAAPLAIRSVDRLVAFLDSTRMAWEVIVVDDGGGDFAPGDLTGVPRVQLLRLPVNRGKGAAVAHGMKAAKGHVRVFTDVDLPYDLELISAMVDYVRTRGFHLVIGDRTLPQSSYHGEITFIRRLASTLFSAFVGTLVTGGFFDTQCGLKAMRGDVADALLAIRRLDRFAFDVELIYLALHHRLDIKRIPVQLRNNETSSVRLIRDSVRGFVDIARIKYNQLHGHYESDALERLVYEEFTRFRDRRPVAENPNSTTARAPD
jgi:dolichyl-phosphate beta-glucosyltransferase